MTLSDLSPSCHVLQTVSQSVRSPLQRSDVIRYVSDYFCAVVFDRKDCYMMQSATCQRQLSLLLSSLCHISTGRYRNTRSSCVVGRLVTWVVKLLTHQVIAQYRMLASATVTKSPVHTERLSTDVNIFVDQLLFKLSIKQSVVVVSERYVIDVPLL